MGERVCFENFIFDSEFVECGFIGNGSKVSHYIHILV